MLDFSFGEILVIAIIAVIFLGPDKLPQTFLNIAKFFKTIKKTINEAKETLDKEININELKQEAIAYKNTFEENAKIFGENLKKDTALSELDSILNTPLEYDSTSNNVRVSKPKITSMEELELASKEIQKNAEQKDENLKTKQKNTKTDTLTTSKDTPKTNNKKNTRANLRKKEDSNIATSKQKVESNTKTKTIKKDSVNKDSAIKTKKESKKSTKSDTNKTSAKTAKIKNTESAKLKTSTKPKNKG